MLPTDLVMRATPWVPAVLSWMKKARQKAGSMPYSTPSLYIASEASTAGELYDCSTWRILAAVTDGVWRTSNESAALAAIGGTEPPSPLSLAGPLGTCP